MTQDFKPKLVRSAENKWVAGVAGGLAQHFNVDPILVRIAFVILTFANGIGFIAYAAAWALLPKEGESRSVAESAVDRISKDGTRDNNWIWIAALALGGIAFLANMGRWNWDGGGVFWAILLMGTGAWLYLQDLESRKNPGGPVPPAGPVPPPGPVPPSGTVPPPGPVPPSGSPPPPGGAMVVRSETLPVVSDSPGDIVLSDTPRDMVVSDSPRDMVVSDSPGDMVVSDTPGDVMMSDQPGGVVAADSPSPSDTVVIGSDEDTVAEPVPAPPHNPEPTTPIVATGWTTVTQPVIQPVVRTEVISRPPRPVPVRKPRSRLGRYTFAVALVVLGIVAIMENAGTIDLSLPQYGGILLGIIGGGLLVGSVWGRSRFLIFAGILLLPFLFTAGLLGSWIDVPIEGGAGDRAFSPAAVGELQDNYELTAGTLNLDLTDLAWGAQPVEIDAVVGFGEINVLVPQGVDVDVQGQATVGAVSLFGDERAGFGVSYDRASEHTFGEPLLRLDLRTIAGQVEVARSPSQAKEL